MLKVQDEREGQAAAARVLEVIRAPFWLGDKVLYVSASVGLVLGTGGDRADDLMRKADLAMYEAKRLGKNRVHGFSSDLTDKQPSFALQMELAECLKNRGIETHLQPIYAISNGQVSGFEALARWTHPKLGAIPPSTFIPLAEETGSILELGRQMLVGALQAIASWNRNRITPAWVSVNISAIQLSDPELLAFVLATLARHNVDPHLLHLEITESVMLSDDKRMAATLTEARRHGIHVSLDDFGTGYSSLSYLLNFPTDEIKIDRGFIRGIDKDPRRIELVRLVLHLGASLNKRVIAEGVENEQELQILESMGCCYVQGYLLGKPTPADSLERFSGLHGKISRLLMEPESYLDLSPIQ